jgi:Rrf2 family protein
VWLPREYAASVAIVYHVDRDLGFEAGPAAAALLNLDFCLWSLPADAHVISQKTKYALKALMTLADAARSPEGGSLTIEEVARRSGTPKRFLEHILLELRNAGYIGSRRGRSGGYVLIKDPKAISLGDLLRRVDGPIAPLPCLSRHAYQRCEDCTDEANCRIRAVFGQVFWSYLLLIESLTLADLAERSAIGDRILSASAAAGE